MEGGDSLLPEVWLGCLGEFVRSARQKGAAEPACHYSAHYWGSAPPCSLRVYQLSLES